MAITGEQIFKGLTISSAYVRVMNIYHRTVDTSTEADDGTITWSTTLYADYSARIYKDASARAANPDSAVTTVSGSFTPTVGASDKNLLKQCYVHLKTLGDFDSLTDA
jgi:hypothetical protein